MNANINQICYLNIGKKLPHYYIFKYDFRISFQTKDQKWTKYQFINFPELNPPNHKNATPFSK